MPKPSLEPFLPYYKGEDSDVTLKPQYRWSNPASSFRHLEPAGLISQPKRRDMEAAKAWLEHRYCPGSASLGSPLYPMYFFSHSFPSGGSCGQQQLAEHIP